MNAFGLAFDPVSGVLRAKGRKGTHFRDNNHREEETEKQKSR